MQQELTRGAASAAGHPGQPESHPPGAITVAGLRKSYGSVQAVRDVSFSVRRGEIVALLGPNGAGKTTTLEILEGFRARDGGAVEVLGLDPGDRSAARDLRERTGLVLQDIAVEPYLTVRETLARQAGYYQAPRAVPEVIGLAGLTGLEKRKVRSLSGGQKRRLDLALGLIGSPELLYLDEPTTGFDPAARHDAWDLVRQLRAAGTTILRDAERARISFRLPPGLPAADLPVPASVQNGVVMIETARPTEELHRLTGWAMQRGVALSGLTVDRPSLEDIYLRLTSDGAQPGAPERSTR
jgi:ABC-2 type transport system ATP-binding protein